MAKRWTAKEKAYVRRHYKKQGAERVAAMLARTVSSVHHVAARLDLPAKRRVDAWTEQDDRLLRQQYPKIGAVGVSQLLSRSVTAVRHRAVRQGVRAGAQVRECRRERWREARQHLPIRTIGTWKQRVKERDGFTCQTCRLREPLIVTAHHIVPVSDGGSRLSLDNGVTLCPNCHALVHATCGHKSSGRRVSRKTYRLIREMLAAGATLEQVASAVSCNHKTIARKRKAA